MNKDIELLMAVDAMNAAGAQEGEVGYVAVEADGLHGPGPATAAGPPAPLQRSSKKPAAHRREAPTA